MKMQSAKSRFLFVTLVVLLLISMPLSVAAHKAAPADRLELVPGVGAEKGSGTPTGIMFKPGVSIFRQIEPPPGIWIPVPQPPPVKE